MDLPRYQEGPNVTTGTIDITEERWVSTDFQMHTQKHGRQEAEAEAGPHTPPRKRMCKSYYLEEIKKNGLLKEHCPLEYSSNNLEASRKGLCLRAGVNSECVPHLPPR